jgi:hypothetical protein
MWGKHLKDQSQPGMTGSWTKTRRLDKVF